MLVHKLGNSNLFYNQGIIGVFKLVTTLLAFILKTVLMSWRSEKGEFSSDKTVYQMSPVDALLKKETVFSLKCLRAMKNYLKFKNY